MNITGKMKSLSVLCMALMAACAVAQEIDGAKEGAPAGGPPHRMGRPRPEMNGANPGGPIFARMLSRPEFLGQLGLPEETAKKIGDELAKIAEEEKALFQERMKLSKAQADALAALMSDRTKTGDDAMKAITDLEAISSKLAALNIRRMIVVRDNLTDEQIAKASELVKKRFADRRQEMMRGRRGDAQQGGPDGPGGPGAHRKHPKRDEGAKPQPPAEGGEAAPPPPPAEGVEGK